MITKDLWRGFLSGTSLALVLGAGSFLLARYALGHVYYLSVLLPAAMVTLLLLAWLMHLRSDGFFGGATNVHSPPGSAEHHDGRTDRLQASFDDDILERTTPVGQHAPALKTQDVVPALLWGAAELGLLAIALYHWAGIGSRLLR